MSLSLARRDFARFTQAEFSTVIKIQPSPAVEAIEVNAFATKHHLSVSAEGLAVNSKNTHCTIAESVLVAAGYTVRNVNNEVALIGHLITFTDSSGTEWIYKINETMPDETFGQITCFLGDYELGGD